MLPARLNALIEFGRTGLNQVDHRSLWVWTEREYNTEYVYADQGKTLADAKKGRTRLGISADVLKQWIEDCDHNSKRINHATQMVWKMTHWCFSKMRQDATHLDLNYGEVFWSASRSAPGL